MDRERRTVVVTGFGPFLNHEVNASWEAVKLLKNSDIEEKYNLNLVTLEIPVVYETICSVLPELWLRHQPMLVIHVGVSGLAQCLELESRAHGTGYVRHDVETKLPDETNIEPHVLETGIDVKAVASAINNCSEKSGCKAIISHDAGRYICEYTFHGSLSIEPHRSMFIHVPDFDVYTTEQVAAGLYDAIRFALQELEGTEIPRQQNAVRENEASIDLHRVAGI